MSNRSDGNKFEQEFCQRLADSGWWCHNMAQNAAGQPADVIAVKNGCAILVDCKLCATDSFELTRIEANQQGAMTLWENCGNSHTAYFAVKFKDNSIYMVEWGLVKDYLLMGKRSMKPKDIRACMPLWTFLEVW